MAYKRTSRSSGNTRKTTSYNSKTGKTITSNSFKSGSVRITQSSVNGQNRTTTTYTTPDGYVNKKTVNSGVSDAQRRKEFEAYARKINKPKAAPKPLKAKTTRVLSKSKKSNNSTYNFFKWLLQLFK